MRAIRIIEATEESKRLGFHEGREYMMETVELKPYNELTTFIVNDSVSRWHVLTIILSGATIKMVKL